MTDLIDLVENYFEGDLSSEEKSVFEARLRTDTELQAVYQERLVVREAIEAGIEDDMRQRFRAIDTEESISDKSSYRKYWLLASLIAAFLIISLAIWKQTSDIDPVQIANTYSVDTELDTYRSSEKDSTYSQEELKYYSTMSQAHKEMQNSQFEESRITLELLDDSSETVRDNQQWMTAISYYLENGRKDIRFQKILKDILAKPEHNCYNLAMLLDEEVNSFWGRLKR